MSSLVRSPLILYASETGNAEDVAFSLHRQWNHLFASQSVNFRIFSVEDYDFFSLTSEELVIFVLSTCGDGEFPIPMRTMWTNLLRRNLPPGLLSESKFAVFGLGDSSYEKFNAAARKLYVRLGQLGAKPLLEFTDCLGDDQAGEGYLASLDPWTKKLTPLLWKELVRGESTSLVEGALTTAAVKSSLIQYTVDSASQGNGPQEELFHPLGKKSHENDNSKVYKTSVSENNRLTAADWSQAVHNVTFTLIDATDPALDYEAGDIAQLYYSNPKVLVDPLLTYFSDDNRVVNIIAPTIQYRRSRLQGSLSCSLVELFRDVLDIGSIPKRSFFEALAAFADNDEERDKLLEISSARGADLYYDYCLRERRNYTEVLLDFPSVRIPLEFFIGLVPIIQPRPYSIASSPKYKERSLELCVAVVQRVTPYKRRRTGLCSGFIAQLCLGDIVYLRIQRGSFPHFSKNGTFPKHMLLIGPGTGIAPMRALLQDRLLSVSAVSPPSSSINVFFGCRREKCDELYEAEWSSLNEGRHPYGDAPTLLPLSVKVHVAHSQNIGQLAKVYVTHLLEQQSHLLFDILRDPDTFIGIAGSAKRMPKDVKQSLVRILMRGDTEKGIAGLSEEEAQRWLQAIIREKRLIIEAWG